MGAQDNTEKILREMHLLLAHSDKYNDDPNLIVIDKRDMLTLLSELSQGIYDIRDEYDLTKRGRDQVERENKKRGEEIINDATKKAEDVYAASVMYTDEALHHVQDIIDEATESIKTIYSKLETDLKKEKAHVRKDQSDLKGYLQDLKDTDEYLSIIKDRNKKIAKEKLKEMELETPSYASVKPEIRINEDYFREHGLTLEEEAQPEEKKEPVKAQVNVNLDSEYFRQKEQGVDLENMEILDLSEAKKPEKKGIFGKKK